MGYSSTGVYTGPTGSIDSTPGAVIRSATWNTINISYAAALTQVGQQLFNGPATVTVGPYTVASTIASLIFNGGGSDERGEVGGVAFPVQEIEHDGIPDCPHVHGGHQGARALLNGPHQPHR